MHNDQHSRSGINGYNNGYNDNNISLSFQSRQLNNNKNDTPSEMSSESFELYDSKTFTKSAMNDCQLSWKHIQIFVNHLNKSDATIKQLFNPKNISGKQIEKLTRAIGVSSWNILWFWSQLMTYY